MPILDVKVSAPFSPALVERISSSLAGLTTSVLQKKPEVIAIAVSFVDPAAWVIAGKTLAAQGKSSFFLDIRVTDETNTKDEKARYIAEVFRAMGEALREYGPLHEESYIHVHDVRAAAYGYGGLTQERRYHRPAEPAP